MADEINVNVHLAGANPSTVHIHLTIQADNTELLDRLTALELIMSDVSVALDALNAQVSANTDATLALAGRITEDVAHLQDLNVQQAALTAQALQTAADDQVQIDALQAQLDALTADAAATTTRINDATAGIVASTTALAAIDPDPSFPAAPPADPADPATGTSSGLNQP
jgi:hypothetical protein